MFPQQIASKISVEVAPHRVDVIAVILRRVVLDEELRALHAVVVRLALLGRACPGETHGVEALGGTRHARKIFAAPAIAQHSKGEIQPGPDIKSDADLLAYARRAGNTLYHPVGTCRMGEDPRAVVDSRLRVRGIQGLRVIDASVMPTLTTGNTNAPTIMIGEKGATMIAEDAR
jgi:choline dehydrogenase-like flavoprotein